MSVERWDIQEAGYHSELTRSLLFDGWEPFSATYNASTGQYSVWFRRRKDTT